MATFPHTSPTPAYRVPLVSLVLNCFRLCSPEVLLSICLWQFGPSRAVSSGEAHSPGVAALRLGLFNLGPVGALSLTVHGLEQKSCLPSEQGPQSGPISVTPRAATLRVGRTCHTGILGPSGAELPQAEINPLLEHSLSY